MTIHIKKCKEMYKEIYKFHSVYPSIRRNLIEKSYVSVNQHYNINIEYNSKLNSSNTFDYL